MPESRDAIKTRMLRNAARTWGYPEAESENNFDPLVSMLLSACAVELEKISGEIYSSRARVLERMVQLLSPDALTGARPAHAVATATPLESRMLLAENAQFYVPRSFRSNDENDTQVWKDVFFTPTSSFTIVRASIRFMATGSRLFRLTCDPLKERMTNGIIKEAVGQTEAGKELPANSLWLGINEPDVSLQDSLFYFDLRNDANRQQFYHQLPGATWYWNDKSIPHLPGYGNRLISGEQLDLKSLLQKEDDVCGKIQKQVNAYYKPYFITLTDPDSITLSRGNRVLREMVEEAFTGKPADMLKQENLRWICIDFPQTISNLMLEDVVCTLNCFPVFNRRAYNLTHRMQDIVNVIPLQTDELFLDLEEVKNDEGKVLNTRTFQKNDHAAGILLRTGGVGRFDERDAASLVNYLIQLLRDESAAFSSIGNDFINNEMKQLQQIINKLEQRMFTAQIKQEATPYLIVRNSDKNKEKSSWQNIFIHYWSTNGTEGNGVKAGSMLMQHRGSSLHNNLAVLVSTTVGGSNKLNQTESVLAFKSALLSKDRLITPEDIKAFCHSRLGERVYRIDIDKGIMIHTDQQKGYMKTIDVKIDIRKQDYEEMMRNGEINYWTDNLKLMLEEKSLTLVPYRIFIRQAA